MAKYYADYIANQDTQILDELLSERISKVYSRLVSDLKTPSGRAIGFIGHWEGMDWKNLEKSLESGSLKVSAVVGQHEHEGYGKRLNTSKSALKYYR